MTRLMSGAIGVAVVAAVVSMGVSAQQNQMSFFITSAGPGNGANLGGLAGADKQCQTLAAAAGAPSRPTVCVTGGTCLARLRCKPKTNKARRAATG